jgi:putative alpha-1,2-mannosidase
VRNVNVLSGASLMALVVGALVVPGTHGTHGPRPARAAAAEARPSALVDPVIGTDARGTGDNGGGNTFPGPVVPNGMIRLGPDTFPGPADGGGGYAYADTRMRGFSLTRLSGTGCPTFGDVPITATTVPIATSPVDAGLRDVRPELMSTFSHDTETATPGFYAVDLVQASGDVIGAQLSTATRAAVARFTFPESTPAGGRCPAPSTSPTPGARRGPRWSTRSTTSP